MRLALFAITVLPLLAMAEMPKQIQLVAPDYWCPYSCNAKSDQQGFVIEITKAAFAQVGIEMLYVNRPYDRAISSVEQGEFDAVLPTFKQEVPGFIFPKQPISASQFCFYTSDNNWQYQGLNSLNNVKLLATSGYSYDAVIDQYLKAQDGNNVKLMKGSEVPERMYKMVQTQRFDAFLDDTLLISYLSKTQVIGDDIHPAGCLAVNNVGYLALSPKHPEQSNYFAKAFDQGMAILLNEKKSLLLAILLQYGIDIDDWQKNIMLEQ
ncbi:substrate-binding periplasmic protein [Colwellia sp. MEBiC06753]